MTTIDRIAKIALIVIILLLSVSVIQAPNVSANIPSVTLTSSLSGTHVIVNISVTHGPPPDLSTSHYVDQVEITITNATGTFMFNWTTAASSLPAAPQPETFSNDTDIGVVQSNTTVSVRAHDVVHKWGSPAYLGPPSQPQNAQLTAGDGYVLLNWSAPTSTGGTPITNYTIYRGSPSGPDVLTTLGNVLTYNDTTVVNNNTYTYQVGASNMMGQGTPMTIGSATPAPGTGGEGTAPAAFPWAIVIAVIVVVIILIIIGVVMLSRRKATKK